MTVSELIFEYPAPISARNPAVPKDNLVNNNDFKECILFVSTSARMEARVFGSWSILMYSRAASNTSCSEGSWFELKDILELKKNGKEFEMK
jgi:hypothetical protein